MRYLIVDVFLRDKPDSSVRTYIHPPATDTAGDTRTPQQLCEHAALNIGDALARGESYVGHDDTGGFTIVPSREVLFAQVSIGNEPLSDAVRL